METKEFIESTIKNLNDEIFLSLKRKLLGEYISFNFYEDDDVTKELFAEKLCDYFEKLEIKTKSKFENMLKTYIANWDNLIGKRIAKTPSTKKNEPPAPVPRARKYYDKIQEIKKSRELTLVQVVDYSRIAMCLYTAIVEADYAEISNFDYSVNCLDISKIISAMKDEKGIGIPIGKKALFDLTDLYCEDTATFILSIIVYYYIKNNEIKGDY